MLLTPTYHVFRMYVPFQDATSLPVKFDAGRYTEGTLTMPRADVVAAQDRDGVSWVALTNVDPDHALKVEISVAGQQVKSVRGEVLSATNVDAVNTFAAPRNVEPRPIAGQARDGRARLELPPKSVTVVSLR
jgi:alpha-N-arabinofuranosidase